MLMFVNLVHFQITTENEVGLARRHRNIERWIQLNLPPTYISKGNDFIDLSFFNSALNRKLRGISGCLDTHRLAWHEFVKGDAEYLLITEDDSVPKEGLEKELAVILNLIIVKGIQTPTLIQLGTSEPAGLTLKRTIVALKHGVQYKGSLFGPYVRHLSFGTHGYLLNKPMAEFLLNTISGSLVPIDIQFMLASRNPDFFPIIFQRRMLSLIDQEMLDSSIEVAVQKKWRASRRESKVSAYLKAIADSDCARSSLFMNIESVNK